MLHSVYSRYLKRTDRVISTAQIIGKFSNKISLTNMQKSRNLCQSSRPKRCNILLLLDGPKSAQKIASTLTHFLSISHFYGSDTGRKKQLLLIPRSVLMPCEACRMPAGTIQLSNINEHLAGLPLAFLNMHAICFCWRQATWRGKVS